MSIHRPISESATILTFPRDAIREVGCDVRILTKRCNRLLGNEYLIGYGARYFRCGDLSLSQLKRGVSPDELCMLEIEDPENPGWDD